MHDFFNITVTSHTLKQGVRTWWMWRVHVESRGMHVVVPASRFVIKRGHAAGVWSVSLGGHAMHLHNLLIK